MITIFTTLLLMFPQKNSLLLDKHIKNPIYTWCSCQLYYQLWLQSLFCVIWSYISISRGMKEHIFLMFHIHNIANPWVHFCLLVYRLLVGAPRAKALSKQKSQITGGMYNCDITSASQSCQRVMFDNEGNLKHMQTWYVKMSKCMC